MRLELSYVRPTYHRRGWLNNELQVELTHWFKVVSTLLSTANYRATKSALRVANKEITTSPDEWTTMVHDCLVTKLRDGKKFYYKLNDQSVMRFWNAILYGVRVERMDFAADVANVIRYFRTRDNFTTAYKIERLYKAAIEANKLTLDPLALEAIEVAANV
jgi:hypothetical protein